MKNQAFEQMNQVALQWLSGRDSHDIAEKAGISYDGEAQCFFFSSLGMDLTMTYPDYRITPQVGKWHYLLILHYLHLADGSALTGEGISFGQMQGGMVRGGGIDRKCEMAIRAVQDFDALAQACRDMGGREIPSNADAAYCIPFLPRLPVTLKIWFADEEFPASGRLFLDGSADHYFTAEDAVAMAEMLLERLTVPAQERTFS